MNEPLFKNVQNEDEERLRAYSQAESTITDFITLVRSNISAVYMAKLKFRESRFI